MRKEIDNKEIDNEEFLKISRNEYLGRVTEQDDPDPQVKLEEKLHNKGTRMAYYLLDCEPHLII